MNTAHFMAISASYLACSHDFIRGYRYDHLGKKLLVVMNARGVIRPQEIKKLEL
jgi:hypothetical protein